MNNVIVVEQLRFALLSDIRTVAKTLNRISDGIDAELASASPNLDSLQERFLEIATTLATRTHLHERIGWPGERITSAPLSFTSVEERDLALEILSHYRHRLATRHIDAPDSAPPVDTVELLTGFLRSTRLVVDPPATTDPASTITVRRATGDQP